MIKVLVESEQQQCYIPYGLSSSPLLISGGTVGLLRPFSSKQKFGSAVFVVPSQKKSQLWCFHVMWKHQTAGRLTVLQISLLQPTEQLSVTADFRALLHQAKLKWFNMQGNKIINYMHLSLFFSATFSLCFGVLGVAIVFVWGFILFL